MTSGRCFDDLPNEIILKIFAYLNVEDLALSTKNVSLRWKELSQDNKLWKNAFFIPRKEMTDENIVEYLENMPGLRSYFATRQMSDLVVDAMCRFCKDIRHVELHKSDNIKFSLLQKIIKHFPHIEVLRISLPYLFSEQLKCTQLIGKCKELSSLSIEGNPDICLQNTYEGVLIPIADGCPVLQHIHLGNYRQNYGQIDEEIQKLLDKKKHNLLSFSCKMYVTKEVAENISECIKLQHLDIENYNDFLLYDDIKSFMKLSNLKYFAFRFCSEDVVINLPTFFHYGLFSQIVHLDLSESYFINDIIVTTVFENCPQLQHLNVSGSQSLQNEGLRCIGKCTRLKHLDVSVCMDLTDGSMEYVGEGCHSLKHLDISGCYKMTDKVIEYIVKCKMLKILKFNYNDLTGSNFYLIAAQLPCLTEFHLENCKYLDKLYIDELHKQMASLKIIVARRCKEPFLDPKEAVLLFD